MRIKEQLIFLLLLTIPTLSLISGFSIAITFPILGIVLFTFLPLSSNLSNIFTICYFPKYKLEYFFIFWCITTLFYNFNTFASILSFCHLIFIGLFSILVYSKIDHIIIQSEKIRLFFILGLLISIVFFFIEYFFDGLITLFLRSIFQKKTDIFFLYMLDRGCCVVSLLSWIVIFILIEQKKYFYVSVYFLLIYILLFISDSLSSFISFTIASLVFFLSKLSKFFLLETLFFRSFLVMIIFGSLLMPIVFYKIKPQDIFNKVDFLPLSAKHRVFIWNRVASEVLESPILGHGFFSSRYFSQEKELDKGFLVNYNNASWSTFPLHPHNNIMQVLFELGLIGFLLFLSLIVKNLIKIFKIDKNLNCHSAMYACFVNYYIIGMISWSIWQTWWYCTLFMIIILFKLLIKD